MLSHLPWLDLTLVAACVLYVQLPVAFGKVVKCKVGTDLGNSTTELCMCQKLSRRETPWPGDNEDTAPKPRDAVLKTKKFDGVRFPKIRWSLDRQYLYDVDGFYLEIWLRPNYYEYHSCVYNKSAVSKKFRSDLVKYEFQDCCRTVYRGMEDGSKWRVEIHSLPMYGSEDNRHYAHAELEIPETPDEEEDMESSDEDDDEFEMYEGESRLRSLEDKLEQLTSILIKNSGSSTFHSIVIGVVGAVVMILACVVAFAVFLYSRRHSTVIANPKATRRVLLLTDENELQIKFSNRLVELIKNCSKQDVDVVANVRKTEEIAKDGIVKWTTKNVSDSDVVVILVFDSSQIETTVSDAEERKESGLKHSPVAVALNAACSQAPKLGFRTCKNKFVVMCVNARESPSIPFCAQYDALENLRDSLKHILGTNFDPSVDIKGVRDVLSRLSSEISSNNSNDTATGARKKVTKSPSNNLDLSLLPDGYSLTPEINDLGRDSYEQTALQSVEENERVV